MSESDSVAGVGGFFARVLGHLVVDRLLYESHAAFVRVTLEERQAMDGREPPEIVVNAMGWTTETGIGALDAVRSVDRGGARDIEWAFARRDAWFKEAEVHLVLADRKAAIEARSIPRLERLLPLAKGAALDEVVAALVDWSTPNLTGDAVLRLYEETDDEYRARVRYLRQFRISR